MVSNVRGVNAYRRDLNNVFYGVSIILNVINLKVDIAKGVLSDVFWIDGCNARRLFNE